MPRRPGSTRSWPSWRRHGATLDAKDKQGRTPVDVALGVGGRGRAGGPPPVHTATADLIKKLMAQ